MKNRLGPSQWQTSTSEVKYTNPWLTVREDAVVRPGGDAGTYSVMETAGPGVLIVAFDELDHVALVTTDRYPLRALQLELPGGACDDEDFETAARRELLEECGLAPARIESMGNLTVLGGLVKHCNTVVIAYQCRPVSGAAASEDDVVGFEFYSVPDVLAMIHNDTIVDAESIAALMKAFLHTGHLVG